MFRLTVSGINNIVDCITLFVRPWLEKPVSPVTWHAGNDWVGCCGIITDNKRPDLPIQKWRWTAHRSMMCAQETAPLFYQSEDASIVPGRRETKPHTIAVDGNGASLPIPII
jgi:hypothetical protein